jgi:protein-L-isoaspartate(D-aspartate) O-methyltransferase
MLRLLALLDLQPGQRVLEIGSGSGWLVALMSRLTAPDGLVIGVERIPSLVDESRAALARTGIERVEIHLADGAQGHASAAPFDRAIVTASSYDVPRALFEQIREGGLLVIPIADPSGQRNEVVLLERRGAGFVKRSASIGDFVPFTGASARRNPRACALADVPGWSAVAATRERHSLRFGATSRRQFGFAANGFRMFLARRDPRYVVSSPTSGDPAPPWFGLADPSGASLALCSWDGLCGYGESDTMRALLDQFATWCRLGMPGPDVFDLEVLPTAGSPVSQAHQSCVDVRGDATLHWSLRDGLPELPFARPGR